MLDKIAKMWKTFWGCKFNLRNLQSFDPFQIIPCENVRILWKKINVVLSLSYNDHFSYKYNWAKMVPWFQMGLKPGHHFYSIIIIMFDVIYWKSEITLAFPVLQ